MKPLGDEDRAAFQSGTEALDSYFRDRASRDVREKLSAVFIVVAESEPTTILGFYTLSAQQLDAGNLPEELRKKTGRYQHVGVTLLGRLAVDKSQRGRGLGEFLLIDALIRSYEGTKNVMSYAVVVDAKDEKVIKFYKKYGFIQIGENRLMLPMKTIEKTSIQLSKANRKDFRSST